MEIEVTRLYTGSDGESHFEDMSIPLDIDLGASQRSEIIKAKGIIFQEFRAKEIDWHNAPRRQYIISLGGIVEVEVGDGTKHRIKPGDIVLAEDITGQGHITRPMGDELHKAIFVVLD